MMLIWTNHRRLEFGLGSMMFFVMLVCICQLFMLILDEIDPMSYLMQIEPFQLNIERESEGISKLTVSILIILLGIYAWFCGDQRVRGFSHE